LEGFVGKFSVDMLGRISDRSLDSLFNSILHRLVSCFIVGIKDSRLEGFFKYISKILVNSFLVDLLDRLFDYIPDSM